MFDYLTRFSGLMHGDLDPSASKHYLTTLKVLPVFECLGSAHRLVEDPVGGRGRGLGRQSHGQRGRRMDRGKRMNNVEGERTTGGHLSRAFVLPP